MVRLLGELCPGKSTTTRCVFDVDILAVLSRVLYRYRVNLIGHALLFNHSINRCICVCVCVCVKLHFITLTEIYRSIVNYKT